MLNLFSIICYVISAIILMRTHNPNYGLLFLEPFIFGLLYSINSIFQLQKFHSISLGIIFVTSFFRYVCLPLIMCLAGYPNITISYCSLYISQAVLLQIYEECCVLLVVHFLCIKYFASGNSSCSSFYSEIIFEDGSKIILWIFVLLGVAVALAFPSLLSRYHFVISLVGNEKADQVEYAGLGVLITISRHLLMLLILAFFYNQYLKNYSMKWILFSLSVICCNALVINDLSRFGLLIPLASWLYLLYQIYPNIRKRLLSVSFTILIVLLSFVTYIKAFSKYRGDSANIVKIDYWCNSFQTYFQGINDICIGLYASQNINILSFKRFINDAISNVAFLSHFSDPNQLSLKKYNIVYNGWWVQDKILPNICAGYYYFGFLGAPIISCIFVCLAMKFDVLSQRYNNVYYKFIFIFAAINCSFSNMIYYPMMISPLINSILIMYLILRINDRIKW